MKRFEGLVATGVATALLASGCGGATKQQSPEVVRGLTNTIKPVALKMASKAILLSKGSNAKFFPYYADGETTLSHTVDNPLGGYEEVSVTFKGDESHVSLKTLETIQVDEATCHPDKKSEDGFNCPEGTTLTLYAPTATYEGQRSWQASNQGYIVLPHDDFPTGGTADSHDNFEMGMSAVPTAKDIVRDTRTFFNLIVATPGF